MGVCTKFEQKQKFAFHAIPIDSLQITIIGKWWYLEIICYHRKTGKGFYVTFIAELAEFVWMFWEVGKLSILFSPV